MVAAAGRLEPERDPRPRRHGEIRAGLGVGQDLLERRGVRLPLEPKPQLLLGDAQLAQVRRVEIRARSRGTPGVTPSFDASMRSAFTDGVRAPASIREM